MDGEILLAPAEDDIKQQQQNNNSYSTDLTEDTPIQTDGDDQEFLQADQTPAKVLSQSVTNDEDSSVDTQSINIHGPGKLDVLCGQSRTCASHSGNRYFQQILERYAPKYDAVNSKQEKMTLTKEIVAHIQNEGGRFLRMKDKQWQEIPTVTARDKVSHALRTKVASLKRQQQEKSDGNSSSVSSVKSAKKPTHRGRRSGKNNDSGKCSSSSSVNSRDSDIVSTSFDGQDPRLKIEDLIKTQRAIFATLQSSETSKHVHHPLRRSSR